MSPVFEDDLVLKGEADESMRSRWAERPSASDDSTIDDWQPAEEQIKDANIEHVRMYVGSIHPLLVCQETRCLPVFTKIKKKPKKPKAWRRNLVKELCLFFLQRKTLGPKTPWLNTISLSSSGAIKVLQTDLGAALPQGLRVPTLLCRQLWFAFTANITAISQVNPSAEEFLSVDSF